MLQVFLYLNYLLIVFITFVIHEIRIPDSLEYSFYSVNDYLPSGTNNIYVTIFVCLLISITFVIIEFTSKKYTTLNKNYFYFLFVNMISWLGVLTFFKIYEIQRAVLILNFLVVPIILFYLNKRRNLNYFAFAITLIIVITFQNNILNTNQIISDNDSVEDALYSSNSSENEASSQTSYENFQYSLENTYKLSPRLSLEKYNFCCEIFARKYPSNLPGGYLQIHNSKLILVNGLGDIVFFEIEPIINERSIEKPKLIKNNLEDIINNKNIFKGRDETPQFESVRGAKVINDKLYISYIEEVSENCLNLEIVNAKLNDDELVFEKFFEDDECLTRSDEINVGQSGGKMEKIDDDYMLLTTGVWKTYSKPQDNQSIFGKTLKINLNNGEYEIVSSGHRNPQGLSKTKYKNIFISTEHGDLGGDEINLIDINQKENFGYPISSYGEHYDLEFKEDAPLYDSHIEYGFKEPIYYFNTKEIISHGISDVVINYFSENNSFFIATLNARRLYEVDVNIDKQKVNDINTYSYEFIERIRDIEYDKKNNVYFIFFEESPSLGVLKLTENR
tara:strand:+ start:497 stop:2182 length:1686 start_codon:yes stop_codon:yes gene_type:complete